MKIYTQLSNLYNKVIISRCLDWCLDESVPILDTFWSGYFCEIQDYTSTVPAILTRLSSVLPFFPKLKIHLKGNI